MNIPAFFALVHAQNDAGRAWRMVLRPVEQQETGPQLGHRNRMPIQNQIDPDISGVAGEVARL